MRANQRVLGALAVRRGWFAERTAMFQLNYCLMLGATGEHLPSSLHRHRQNCYHGRSRPYLHPGGMGYPVHVSAEARANPLLHPEVVQRASPLSALG
jgi:hypothetical protein